MTSLREIFRIGRGPSSSHTMAPEKAARYVLEKYPEADRFDVTLFGSLSRTGKGHYTDYAISQTLREKCGGILFDLSNRELPHPNTMEFTALRNGSKIGTEIILSVGGGAIQIFEAPVKKSDEAPDETLAAGEAAEEASSKDSDKAHAGTCDINMRAINTVYTESDFSQIAAYCDAHKLSIPEYVYSHEPEIKAYLQQVWEQMQSTILEGLKASGELPGGLHVVRRAGTLFEYGRRERDLVKKERFLISSYAYAASEQNASGGRMVTAPTCGASGVLPAVLFYEKQLFGCRDEEIVDALAVAGILGQVLKTNGSISGAEAGCQAEIGSACSMAAGALCELRGFGIPQIECAAELAMEHCLGLTCDPVGGLVQIPCIERNAVGALRSYDAASLSEVIYRNRKVSFDDVVITMKQTGMDLSGCYRETSEGGLARLHVNKPGFEKI